MLAIDFQNEKRWTSARNHAPIALDSRRQRIVLYGGHDGDHVFGDTWEWNGAGWPLAAPGARKRRLENGH